MEGIIYCSSPVGDNKKAPQTGEVARLFGIHIISDGTDWIKLTRQATARNFNC